MRKILFVGEKDGTFIVKFLQRQKSYIYISSSGVRLKNLDGDALFIYDTGSYPLDLHIQYDLIFFKNNDFSPFCIEEYLKPKGKILLLSDNQKAKNMLKQQRLPSVTIGIRDCDISISSITDDGITYFCGNEGKLIPEMEGEEKFICGNYPPAGIFPVIAGEVVSFLCGLK